MEETLKQILSEIKELKNDVTDITQDSTGVKDAQERIESKVDNISSELRSNFKFTNEKLDEHRNVFGVVSEEIKGVK